MSDCLCVCAAVFFARISLLNTNIYVKRKYFENKNYKSEFFFVFSKIWLEYFGISKWILVNFFVSFLFFGNQHAHVLIDLIEILISKLFDLFVKKKWKLFPQYFKFAAQRKFNLLWNCAPPDGKFKFVSWFCFEEFSAFVDFLSFFSLISLQYFCFRRNFLFIFFTTKSIYWKI